MNFIVPSTLYSIAARQISGSHQSTQHPTCRNRECHELASSSCMGLVCTNLPCPSHDGYCLLVNLVLSERAVYKQGRPLCRVVRNRLLLTRLTHFRNKFATMSSTFGLHAVLPLHLHGCNGPARPRFNPARLRAAAAATETPVKRGRGRPKKVDSAGTAATAAQQKTEEDVEKYALPLDNADNDIIQEEQPHEMKLDSHESLDELQDKVKPYSLQRQSHVQTYLNYKTVPYACFA